MRLREFQGNAARTPTALATSLQSYLGKLVKVGGASRFYNIGEGPEVGVVYLIDGTEKAFAFSWERDLAAAGVTRVYVWNHFNINNVPDFELDIPVTAEMDELVPALAKWIKTPKLGEISESKLTEARRTTDAEFLQMAQAEFPGTCDNLTWPEIMQVANKNDVQVPGSIRGNVSLKVDAHHWNLSGGSKSSTEHDDAKIAQSLGGELEEPTAQDDEETRNLVNLAKVKTLKKLAGAGRLYLQGKKANGKFFKIPGIEEILVMIERAMTRNLENGIDGDRLTMEQQYEMLREKVTIVAGGKAAFVKSLLITGAPSSGKALALDTPIPTPLGWTTMGELTVGDTIYDENGLPCNVTFATPIQYNRSCFELFFDDGTSVVADADHRWLTSTVASRQSELRSNKPKKGVVYNDQSHKRIKSSVVNTRDIFNTLRAGGKANHRIDNAKSIVGDEIDLPIDPYILGLWLGDGCHTHASMSCGQQDYDQLVKNLIESGQDFKSTLTSRGVWNIQLSKGRGGSYLTKLKTKLRELELLNNKHIPAIYLRASEGQRMALLQGLMDTDGSIDKNGSCEFSSSLEILADGFYELITSLGIKTKKNQNSSTLNGIKKRDRYRFTFKTAKPVFKYERKLQYIQEEYRRKSTTESRAIVAVKPVETVPVRCIMVDSPSHLFLASKSFIPTHNTFAVMQTIIKELGLEPGRDFVIKKGSITPLAMYRTLIEQIDGLVIFDDCDSVIKYPNGINMLKGALDTDPIREVSNDSRGSMNTATMDVGHRNEVIDAISRILRNQPEPGDLERFRHFLKKKKEKKPAKDEPKDYGDEEDDEDNFDMGDELPVDAIDELDDEYERLLHDVQQYLLYHLPNLIDFRGRIIFISNMDESEWDSAILTRAMTVNMRFTSGEMLDYIDNIKSHLKTPNVTDEQKQEVMDYLRELYISGKLRRDVNFRLVQQAFDLRLSSNWKRMIAML